jgi:hypothetical protein
MSIIDSLLSLIPVALQIWLATMLVRRAVHRSFSFFFVYTMFSIIAGIARFLALNYPWTYYYTYWATEALYAVLGFLAIFEVFRYVFQEFYVLLWFRLLIPAVAVLTVGLSVYMAVYSPPMQAPPVLAGIFVAEIAVRCLQAGIFCLLAVLVKFYSVRGRRYALAIAAGFGVSALGTLLTFLLRSEFGTKFVYVLQFVSPVAYIIAVAIWLLVFRKPEPPDPVAGLRSPLTPEQTTELLRRTKKQIKDVLKKECRSLIYYSG